MTAFTTSRLAATLIAATAFFGMHSAVMADDDTALSATVQPVAAAAHATPRLSIGQVVAKLERAGYSHITEVELDDGHYDVEARSPQGQRVDLDVHARTGKIIRSELDD